jgi:hypothetical protein
VNSILKDSTQVEYYTYLGPIFESIHNRQLEYNWLLTDLELNWMPDDFLNYFDQYEVNDKYWDRDNKYWITGERLTTLITNHNIQFIWGVLSGFKKSELIDIRNLSVCPYADGHTELWRPGTRVQHPKAEIEIICWDSTLTLLISKDQSIVKDFIAHFTEARDLDEYNLES